MRLPTKPVFSLVYSVPQTDLNVIFSCNRLTGVVVKLQPLCSGVPEVSSSPILSDYMKYGQLVYEPVYQRVVSVSFHCALVPWGEEEVSKIQSCPWRQCRGFLCGTNFTRCVTLTPYFVNEVGVYSVPPTVMFGQI